MSNNEENFANPVVKSIIDDVTNEVVGVALLHNVPDKDVISYNEHKIETRIAKSIIDWVLNEATGRINRSNSFIRDQKHYGYNQINYDLIESCENEHEKTVNYFQVPVRNKNSFHTLPSDSFEDWSKDSKRSDKMHDQDLADFKVFKLKTLGALYNDRTKDNDYPEETYESELFPQTEYFQSHNIFSGKSTKNKATPDSLYNFSNEEDSTMSIDNSKSVSAETSKQSDSALNMSNRNTRTNCYCECSNIKKHGDGDTNILAQTQPHLLTEETLNLPSDILPPIIDNNDCLLQHNKLLNKESQSCVHEDPTNIDQPFLSEIDRITLDNIQPVFKQEDSNDSDEDENYVPVLQRTDESHSLKLSKVVSPLNYKNDKSSEWINKESDNLFKENNTISEDDHEKPFPSLFNMSPSPRFINYLYMSNNNHTDNKIVNVVENESLESELDRRNQTEENKSYLDSSNNSGEIYSFEEDKNKMSSLTLKETNPFLAENDTVIHVNTAEYDESTHSFKRYYEMFTENNTNINSPTKPSLLEMCKLGYIFDSDEKSTELPDLPNISPNTLENWEEGQEVEVHIIEPVSPKNTDGPTRKTLKRPRPISSDSPQTHRKKVWSAVGLVDKPRTSNILFDGADDEFETEDSTENILGQKNSSEIDIPPPERKNSLCQKSSSEFGKNNLNENSKEVHENSSEVHSSPVSENIKCTNSSEFNKHNLNEHSSEVQENSSEIQECSSEVHLPLVTDNVIKCTNSSEHSLQVNKSDLHRCFSRNAVTECNFEKRPEHDEMDSSDNVIDPSFIYNTTSQSEELTDSKNNTLTKSPAKKGFFAWLINLFRRNKTKTIKEEEDDKKSEAQNKRNSLEKGERK